MSMPLLSLCFCHCLRYIYPHTTFIRVQTSNSSLFLSVLSVCVRIVSWLLSSYKIHIYNIYVQMYIHSVSLSTCLKSHCSLLICYIVFSRYFSSFYSLLYYWQYTEASNRFILYFLHFILHLFCFIMFHFVLCNHSIDNIIVFHVHVYGKSEC